MQCCVTGSCSAIELYCMTAQRKKGKSFSEGLKTVTFRREMEGIQNEQCDKLMVEQRYLDVEVKGLKQG